MTDARNALLPVHKAMSKLVVGLSRRRALRAAVLRVALIRDGRRTRTFIQEEMSDLPVASTQMRMAGLATRGVGSGILLRRAYKILGAPDPEDASRRHRIAWDAVDEFIAGVCVVDDPEREALMRLVAEAPEADLVSIADAFPS